MESACPVTVSLISTPKRPRALADFMVAFTIPESELDAMRSRVESVHLTSPEPENVTYRDVVAGGSVLSSAYVDRKLASHIATAVGVPALVLDWWRATERK